VPKIIKLSKQYDETNRVGIT